ncbi:MAG: CAP domain-containing protein [Patescibacteria group bacterium]|nr:CAP domain-containing protein [Patescibacteria group bacterium]
MKKNIKKQLIVCFVASMLTLLFGKAAFAGEISDNIIIQVNQEREHAGLSQLTENSLLDEAAILKAQDMVDNDYFAHTSPQDVDPWHWLEEVEYQYKYAGENLAMDFSSATTVHKAWMKSESHKENILSNKYTEIGVAVLEGTIENRQTKVAVQFFGTPLSEQQVAFSSFTKDKFDTSVEIVEASVQPWETSVNDEMLVYTRIKGEPKYVEVHVGGKAQKLKKLDHGKYMNLLSLEDIDLRKDSVVIKAELEDGQAIFYQVSQEQYLAHVKGKDTMMGESQQVVSAQGSTQLFRDKALSAQNIGLAVFIFACILMITNVWILEKEEERLLDACGA